MQLTLESFSCILGGTDTSKGLKYPCFDMYHGYGSKTIGYVSGTQLGIWLARVNIYIIIKRGSNCYFKMRWCKILEKGI